MGSYNSQYESYYSTMVNRRKNYGGYRSSSNKNNGMFTLDGNFFARRLTVDLIGVLILFSFVVICKFIVTPETQAAYNFSKEVLNNNYKISSAIDFVKEFDYKSIETKATDWLEGIKVKISGGKTIKDEIKANYILPVNGAITMGFGEKEDASTGEKVLHEGIDIDVAEGTQVVSPAEGKIKYVGQDEEHGKYIQIDHGNGIETKYENLSETVVNVGDSVNKGQIIAKSGSTGKTVSPQLHFELLYMGESRNPEEYFSFTSY